MLPRVHPVYRHQPVPHPQDPLAGAAQGDLRIGEEGVIGRYSKSVFFGK